jgi:hypothetical protein
MTASSQSRSPCLASLLCPTLLLSLVAPAARAAGQAEVRDYQVVVDNKPAGHFHLTVSPGEGGKTVVKAEAAVRVRLRLFTYTYSYQGTEVWAGDRLERSWGNSADGGKKHTVAAVIQGDRATITVDGRSRSDLACAWTTTHWRLPPHTGQEATLAVLDVDAGKRLQARLQRIETVQLSIAGQVHSCTHYRVSGGDEAEMWFDESNRLVRQFTIEDGHRTELRLTGVRPAAQP